MQNTPPRGRYGVPALTLLLIFVAAAIVYAATRGNQDTPPTPKVSATVTVPLAPAATAAVPDRKLEVPKSAVAAVAKSDADDHDDSRNETPPGVTAAQIEAGREQQDRFAAKDQLPLVAPDSAPEQAGCRSRFINSYSSRRGVKPRLFVLHYTVSPNVRGWSDVDGVTGFFARQATQASSNYVIDAEGNCNYIVRESDKAWTQAAANPVSISVEVINTGREPTYIGAAGGPGLAKLARVVHDAAHRWGIPLRRGRVSGCSVASAGIVTHKDLGPCGGGHVDITPYSADQVIQAAAALDRKPAGKPTTSVDRVTCRKLNAYRRAGRPRGGAFERRSVNRRRALTARGVSCTAKGPVRR